MSKKIEHFYFISERRILSRSIIMPFITSAKFNIKHIITDDINSNKVERTRSSTLGVYKVNPLIIKNCSERIIF